MSLTLWLSLSACDVYDSDLLSQGATEAPSTAAGEDDDAGRETCRPNPQPTAACSEICPEVCNGRDDDCDGVVDEASASRRCALPHADAVCREGECLIARCHSGYRDCDEEALDGCEVASDDPEHCGGCGRACALEHATASCASGACRLVSCEQGWGDCDDDGASCETSLDSEAHCGACGAACAGVCVGGRCVVIYCNEAEGRADCDRDHLSCETDLLRDLKNCGACGRVCSFETEVPHASLQCASGSCRAICAEGYGDCDGDYRNGCEQPLTTLQHCGACSRACAAEHASVSCESGRCQRTSCETTYADCDGDGLHCEQSLATVEACGACSVRCALPHAVMRCARLLLTPYCDFVRCEPGWSDCDRALQNGCERDSRPLAEGGTGPCVPDANCTREVFRNHEYYFCDTPRSWVEARALCRTQLRGELAQLRDADTAAFIRARIDGVSWIGAHDQTISGLWRWSNDGVPFWRGGTDGSAIEMRYAAWFTGEPNGSGDCGALRIDGLMDDGVCTTPHAFVCEVSPDQCPDDPAKIYPGQCGCARPDTDGNGDGIAECP